MKIIKAFAHVVTKNMRHASRATSISKHEVLIARGMGVFVNDAFTLLEDLCAGREGSVPGALSTKYPTPQADHMMKDATATPRAVSAPPPPPPRPAPTAPRRGSLCPSTRDGTFTKTGAPCGSTDRSARS